MAEASEHDNFIRSALSNGKYKDQEKTRKTILETINFYKGLKPTTDTFVFNNGTTKLLLALKGTIPVVYRGTTYHIPIVLWLLDTHPYNAPMVYVSPTPDMRIKVSRHVDHNGKVYLPYLHDWKNTTSDLMCLIQVLIMTFQEQPPVYAVNVNQGQIGQGQGHLGQGPPPYPQFGSGNTNAAPYPPSGGPMPMPMPMPMPNQGQGQGQGQSPLPPTPSSASVNFRPSLLSAGEEKLKRRLEDVYLSTEIIKTTGQQLRDGESKLETMMKRLRDEKGVLEKNIDSAQKECLALDEKIRKSTSDEENSSTSIDDAIQTPAPLYKQIVTTVAEEAALEDTIYYLGEAFRREQLDLDQYLRTVRQLSRRQFLARALLKKSRTTAGFAG